MRDGAAETAARKQPKMRARRWHRRWPWIALALSVVALVAAACAQSGASESTGPAARSGGGDQAIVAYQGENVLGAKELDFTDLLTRGKPVVLNFWAGLCPPCRAEMPDFQKVYNENKDKFILVGVDVGPFVGLGSHDDARKLLKELNLSYPMAFAKSAKMVREYNVLGMPTTVFFTPDGKIFRKKTGLMSLGEMRSNVQALLEASGSARQ